MFNHVLIAHKLVTQKLQNLINFVICQLIVIHLIFNSNKLNKI